MKKPPLPTYVGSNAQLELAPLLSTTELAVAQRILIMRYVWDMDMAIEFVKRWVPANRQMEVLAGMLAIDYIMWLRQGGCREKNND